MNRLAILFVCLLASMSVEASDPGASPVKGQRVFVAGHSFHVPIATPLTQIAQSSTNPQAAQTA